MIIKKNFLDVPIFGLKDILKKLKPENFLMHHNNRDTLFP